MENIEDWINKLKSCNKLIIVEGKKDKQTLEKFDIKKIITFSSTPKFYLEKIKEKEVVILTDIDASGKKQFSILKHELQKRGIKIDNRFRNFLTKNTNITHIEGIKLYTHDRLEGLSF